MLMAMEEARPMAIPIITSVLPPPPRSHTTVPALVLVTLMRCQWSMKMLALWPDDDDDMAAPRRRRGVVQRKL